MRHQPTVIFKRLNRYLHLYISFNPYTLAIGFSINRIRGISVKLGFITINIVKPAYIEDVEWKKDGRGNQYAIAKSEDKTQN